MAFTKKAPKVRIHFPPPAGRAEEVIGTTGMVLAKIDEALLAKIVERMMSCKTVDLNGKRVPVSRTRKYRLTTMALTMDGRQYLAIEQIAEKRSR